MSRSPLKIGILALALAGGGLMLSACNSSGGSPPPGPSFGSDDGSR